MKITMHNGRSGSAVHNDRSWDPKKEHEKDYLIIPGRFLKEFWNDDKPLKKGKSKLEQSELRLYEKLYKNHVKAVNDRYKKEGHKERTQTIDKIYRNERTRPEEQIFQLGKAGDTPNRDVFEKCLREYVSTLEKEFTVRGGQAIVMDASIHYDETTPHAHIRFAYFGQDKDGNRMP